MKMFAGETTMKLLARMGMKEGDAIEHPWLSKKCRAGPAKVEERNFQVRKNILEYDEVMEHQRQRFYGLRQRVLEGRRVKGLIFEYTEDVVDDAIRRVPRRGVRRDMRRGLRARSARVLHPPERLKGKDADEMDRAIRASRRRTRSPPSASRSGEYIPVEGSEVSIDFDSAGLYRWAKNRFGIELDTGSLREGGVKERRAVQEMLEEAAAEKIEQTPLERIPHFADPRYGPEQLAKWVKEKFGFEIDVDEIVRHRDDDQLAVRDLIIERARETYTRREAEFPAEFILQRVMGMARQNPGEAFEHLRDWARRRAGLELTAEEIKTTPPQKMRDRLVGALRDALERDDLEEMTRKALETASDDELDELLRARYGEGITERMRYLEDEEREDAIRARVETLARPELVQFEQMVIIETLDSSWKDHLYAMDQLRDSIGFRAFAQTDPKIEYKREGQRMFQGDVARDPREGHGLHLQGASRPPRAGRRASPDGSASDAAPRAGPAADAGSATGAGSTTRAGRPRRRRRGEHHGRLDRRSGLLDGAPEIRRGTGRSRRPPEDGWIRMMCGSYRLREGRSRATPSRRHRAGRPTGDRAQ